MNAWILRLILVVGLGLAVGARAETTLGLGANYFQTIDHLDKPFKEDGLAPLLSLRMGLAPLLKLQVDCVMYPKHYAGASSGREIFSPQAFLLLGGVLYGGLGVGTLFTDGDFADSPFYIARAGVDLALFPGLHLDINASYEFAEWDGINDLDENVDTDTVTLGAALRFVL
jgi:hypothetical protein